MSKFWKKIAYFGRHSIRDLSSNFVYKRGPHLIGKYFVAICHLFGINKNACFLKTRNESENRNTFQKRAKKRELMALWWCRIDVETTIIALIFPFRFSSLSFEFCFAFFLRYRPLFCLLLHLPISMRCVHICATKMWMFFVTSANKNYNENRNINRLIERNSQQPNEWEILFFICSILFVRFLQCSHSICRIILVSINFCAEHWWQTADDLLD